MTDKIYPTWVNDRLPTRKDARGSCVLVWKGISEKDYPRGFTYERYNDVENEEVWCNPVDEMVTSNELGYDYQEELRRDNPIEYEQD